MSVFSKKELAHMFTAGQFSNRYGIRRAKNPHSFPEAKAEWERGWLFEQRERRRQYMFWYSREYRQRKKQEAAKRLTS